MRRILFSVCLLTLNGCASRWEVLDGHRDAGMIDMSYLPHIFASAPPESEAIPLATEKCQLWGYTSAVPFNAPLKFHDWEHSDEDRVIQKFQCTAPEGAPPLVPDK